MPRTLVGPEHIGEGDLSRCLGALAEVSDLSGHWAGMDPQQVVHSLAATVGRLVAAEVLHVSWHEPGQRIHESAYLSDSSGLSDEERLHKALEVLDEWTPRRASDESGTGREGEFPEPDVRAEASSIADRESFAGAHGQPAVFELCFGDPRRAGRLRAATWRADFPSGVELTLLRIACHQAAATLERLRLERDLEAAGNALRSTEQELRGFLENAAVGLHWVDAEGVILWANRTELEMLGYAPEEYIGHCISEFYADSDVAEQVLGRLRRQESLNDFEVRLRCRDGSLRDVAVTSRVHCEQGRFVHTRCFTRDVTDRKQTERRLSAEYAVTQILADSESFEQAAPAILKALRDRLEVEVCELWLPDPSTGRLELAAVDFDETEDLRQFIEEARQLKFGPGEGLPGQVWSLRTCQWMEDADCERDFPRSSAAAAAGLRTSAAMPILIGTELFGVISLLTRRRLGHDAPLMSVMAATGSEIGQFIRQTRAHRALQIEEARKAAILESSLDCIITMDRDGQIVDFNPAAEKVFGFRRDEVVGRPLAEKIIPPRYQARHTAGLERYLRTGISSILNRRLELPAKRSDGSEFPAEITIAATRPDGARPFFTAYLRDLSRQKLEEQRRRAIEERFTTFMKHLPGAAWIKDAQGRYVYANEFAQKIFGTPADELLNRTDEDIFPPATARQFRENDRQARLSSDGLRTIEELRQADGIVHHSLVSKFPIVGANGSAEFVGGVAFDITDWKQAEAALRDSEAQLRSILDNTQSAVFAKDLEGRYIISNRHQAEMFGWPDEQWPLGKTDAELFPPEMATAFTANDRQVLLADAPLEFEEVVAHEGRTSLYLVQKFPLRDAAGKTYGVCGIATDITLRDQTERILRRQALQQQAAAELGSLALSERDLQRVFDRCVETVARVLDHEFCEVLELASGRDNLLLRAGVGWQAGLVGRATVGADPDSQAGFTLAAGEPVVVADLRREMRFHGPQLLHDHGVVSGMSCLIPGPGGRAWGVLGTHTSRTATYSRDDVNFLQTVAHILGSAIHRHTVERALAENEHRLRFTLQAANVGSWDWDMATGRVQWSDNLEAIHGRPPGSFTGTLEDVFVDVYPPDRAPLREAINAALKADGLFEVDYRFCRPDGSLGWLHSQGRATFDDDGRPRRMAGICMEITDRRRSEELAQLLAAAGAHLGQSLDYKSSLQFVAELLVPAWGDLCTIDLRGSDGAPENVAIAHSDPRRVEPARELARRFPPREDDQHGFVHVINTGSTELIPRITDDLLQQVARSEEHLGLLRELELESAVVVPLKARGMILGTMTLCSANPTRRYTPQDASVFEELALRCALAVDIARLYEEAQQEIELRKRTERLLAKAHDAAAAANNAKSEFLANMSHEIRTPMTAILGYADILKGRLENDDDRETLETIRRNGRYLLEIVNDILDLSKIEAGKIQVQRKRIRPDQLIAEVVSLMHVRAKEKGLALTATFLSAIPQTVQTDPTRLRQILVNLIGNAIKFTETGSVDLRVQYLPGEQLLQIDVVDTGIGIPAEQLPRLFEPFVQGDPGVAKRYGGTGLGLTISRRLAELLGGRIDVVSERGRGSTFSVLVQTGVGTDVPLVQPTLDIEQSAEAAPPRTSLDCRVLVVDDRKEVRFLAEHFIRQAGGTVLVGTNGEEALEVVRQAEESGQPVDLILMDMQMPVLDGYEATEHLRRQGFTGPIIALTANAMEGDRERCLQSGCDDYTSKPLNGTELVEMIARYTQQTPTESGRDVHNGEQPSDVRGASPPDKAGAAAGCRVLLVDDSADFCNLMKMLLASRGHDVQIALNGRSALAAAGDFVPHVVLLDLTLPDMSGCEIARELRRRPEMQDVVLVALSGHSESERLRETEAAGIQHYLVKPVDCDKLEQFFPKVSVERANRPHTRAAHSSAE